MPDLHTCTDAELAAEIGRRREAALHRLRALSAAEMPTRSISSSVDEITRLIQDASSIFGVPAHTIHTKNRTVDVVRARQAIWLVLRRRKHTYETIASAFKRNHGTVIHGCVSATNRESSDPSYKAALEALSIQP